MQLWGTFEHFPMCRGRPGGVVQQRSGGRNSESLAVEGRPFLKVKLQHGISHTQRRRAGQGGIRSWLGLVEPDYLVLWHADQSCNAGIGGGTPAKRILIRRHHTYMLTNPLRMGRFGFKAAYPLMLSRAEDNRAGKAYYMPIR